MILLNFKIWSSEENPDGWQLLRDGWMHYWRYETISSGVPGFRAQAHRGNWEYVLKKTYKELNAPLIIAWDCNKNKVRE